MEFGSYSCCNPPYQTQIIWLNGSSLLISARINKQGEMIICLQISQSQERYTVYALFNIHWWDLIPQSHHKLQDQKRESKIHGQLSTLTITYTQEIVYYLLACIHERLLCESTSYYLCNLLDIDHIFWIIYNIGTPDNLQYSIGEQIRKKKPKVIVWGTTARGLHKEGNIMGDSNPK
jgi:hypothetical protein